MWIPSQLQSHPCFVTACTLLFWFWFSSVTVVDMLTFAGVTPCSQVFYISGCPRLSSKGFQHTLDGHEGVLRLAQWGAESRQYGEVSRLIRGPEPQQGLCGIQLLKAFRTVAELMNQRVSVCIVMLLVFVPSAELETFTHLREKTELGIKNNNPRSMPVSRLRVRRKLKQVSVSAHKLVLKMSNESTIFKAHFNILTPPPVVRNLTLFIVMSPKNDQ